MDGAGVNPHFRESGKSWAMGERARGGEPGCKGPGPNGGRRAAKGSGE